uniref:ABC transmembrane type-1 domain-containing protein n=1 Tax=Caenorhabditis japonica TaxID=281687 RepID=A0A8R1IT26_CAEJA
MALTHKAGEEKTKLTPEERSSFSSKIFFCWLNSLIRIGAKNPLTQKDLPDLNQNATSEWLYTRWKQNFEKARADKKKAKKNEDTSIVWPFIMIQKSTIITLTFARLTADIVHYLNPILLKQFIDYVSLPNPPLSFGVAIACIMFLSSTTRSLLQNYQIAGMCRQAVYYQTCLSNAILHKILRLSPSARSNRTAGEILNHAAVDIEIIVHSVPYLQNMWSVPFQVTLAMIMLAITLGWAAMAGVVIMILFIPLNLFTSRFIKLSQQKQMKIKDERTKLSNEQ